MLDLTVRSSRWIRRMRSSAHSGCILCSSSWWRCWPARKPCLQGQVINNSWMFGCYRTKPLLSHSSSPGSPFPCRCPTCAGCKIWLATWPSSPWDLDCRCSYGFAFFALATFRSSFRVSGEGRSLVCIESKAPCRFLKLWTSLWQNLDLREIKIIGQSWRHFEVYDEKKGIMKRLRGKRRVMTNAFYFQLGLLLKTRQKTKALLSIVPVFFVFLFLQNRTRPKMGRNY